jgi:uncharacterized protein YnzC (UPF0291/DUF896 family)
MRYEGNKVVISEQELKWLVNESVKNIIKEERLNEWWGQGIYNGAKNILGAGKDVVSQKASDLQQKAGNMGRNIGNTFNASRQLTNLQNYKAKIEEYLEAIKKMDPDDLDYPIEQLKSQLEMTLQKYQGRLTTARNRTSSTNRYP